MEYYINAATKNINNISTKESNNTNSNTNKQSTDSSSSKAKNDPKCYDYMYEIDKQILLGRGAFGKIHLGRNKYTGEEVAIKLESLKASQPQLVLEFKILYQLQGGEGIPKVYSISKSNKYTILIMERLGNSLEKNFELCLRNFNISTTLKIALQLIDRIQYIHSKGFIHRDIKPDNFLLGNSNKRNSKKIYVIDFGLSKKFEDSKSGLHIPYRDGKSLTGTARYASINNHLGVEQSRRDDIESLGYILLYFLRGGELPWMGVTAKKDKEKYEKILNIKMKTKLEDICKGVPNEFITFIQYARNLKFDEKPDYDFLRKIILIIAENYGLNLDKEEFDWDNFGKAFKFDVEKP